MDINVSNSENAQEAIDRANPGDTLLLQAGTYDSIVIDRQDSIDIATAPEDENKVTFTSNVYDYSRGAGAIHVMDSSNISIKDINATKSLRGIDVEGSKNIILESNEVYDIGQEGFMF